MRRKGFKQEPWGTLHIAILAIDLGPLTAEYRILNFQDRIQTNPHKDSFFLVKFYGQQCKAFSD